MARLDRPVARTPETPVYPIGAAARLSGIPIWTLRWIEKNGLLRPGRTPGRQRLYCDAELELLRDVRGLLEKKVNLAGIRVILGYNTAHGERTHLRRRR